MTDAPPLNGGDPTAIFEWLVAQVTELREENGRMKTLLSLHGIDVEVGENTVQHLAECFSDAMIAVRTVRSEVEDIRTRMQTFEWAQRVGSLV